MSSKTKTLILTSFIFFGLLISLYSASAATVTKTLYSWAKDAAGNISNSVSDSVDITLPEGQANTFYISPSGNDTTGTGTTINPWKSLYKACNSVTTPGTTIHVNTGTYTETQQCVLAIGVSIIGEGTTSIIKDNHTTTGSADWEVALIQIKGNAEGENGNQSISYLKFDGDNLTGKIAITNWRRSNVSVHHCEFINFKESAYINRGGTSYMDIEPTTYAINNTFYNNTVNNCSLYDTWGRGALMIEGQKDMLIYNNYIEQTQRVSTANGYLIKGLGFFKGLKIYNNTLIKSPYDNMTYNFSMEIWTSKGGMEIYGNTIKGNVDLGGLGTFKGTYDFGLLFHDNICGFDTPQIHTNNGLQLESSSESIFIYNNVFKNLYRGLYTTLGDAVGSHITDLTFRNNLCTIGMTTIGGFCVTIGEAPYNPNINNFYIYNNTIVSPTDTGDVGIDIASQGDKSTISNLRIQNNIIQGFINSPIRSYPTNQGDVTIDGLYITNNDMYLNGNINNPRYINITPTNKTTQNNITSNPLFVSSTDFHLQSSSPAIDAGINVGLPYNGSAPDIGVYEYGVLGVSTYHFTLNLKQGSVGNEVKELQKILISNSYLSGTPDGIYGSLTKQAVIKYQKTNNITPLGIVGPKTREVLNK